MLFNSPRGDERIALEMARAEESRHVSADLQICAELAHFDPELAQMVAELLDLRARRRRQPRGTRRGTHTHTAVDLGQFEDVVVSVAPEQLEARTIVGTHSEGATSAQCTVCMDDIAPGDKTRRLPCLDVFHDACISRWLAQNTTCPVCRTDVRGE
mmetsp:Transcript_21784/g.65082  ORF Transcript_21784/g.65082 Transcript_21784/m.65082 type:complete len:156 (-) Transcript_21784:191-658(-)